MSHDLGANIGPSGLSSVVASMKLSCQSVPGRIELKERVPSGWEANALKGVGPATPEGLQLAEVLGLDGSLGAELRSRAWLPREAGRSGTALAGWGAGLPVFHIPQVQVGKARGRKN